MLDLEATIDRTAETVRLPPMHIIATTSALARVDASGEVPATLKKTPPMTATPSAALTCNAEFVMPAIIPEPVAGARLITERTSVGSAQP
jgi:hypothetical protein